MGAASRRRGVESSIMRCQPDSASCQAERLLCKTACCLQPRDCLNVRRKFQLRHLTANTHTAAPLFGSFFFYTFWKGLGQPGPVRPAPPPESSDTHARSGRSIHPPSAAAAHAVVRLMCCENTCPPRLLSPGGGSGDDKTPRVVSPWMPAMPPQLVA